MGSETSGAAPVALAHSGSCQERGEGETGMGAGALCPLFSHILSGVLYTDHLKNLALPKNGIRAMQFRNHHFEKKVCCSLLLHTVLFSLISA